MFLPPPPHHYYIEIMNYIYYICLIAIINFYIFCIYIGNG